jgi:hypothetical protein
LTESLPVAAPILALKLKFYEMLVSDTLFKFKSDVAFINRDSVYV